MATENGWHPIDTAPKDDTLVDLWVSRLCEDGGSRYADLRWDGAFWEFADGMLSLADCDVGPYDVTHWRPTQTGPKGETPVPIC